MRKRKIIKTLFLLILSIFILNITPNRLASQTITLVHDTPLKKTAENDARIYAHARVGDEISIISNTEQWVYLSFHGKKYFTEFNNIYKQYDQAYIGVSETPVSSSTDPTCDYGLPYSGSNSFFDRPLAKMRHIDPLGFIFGNHERYHC